MTKKIKTKLPLHKMKVAVFGLGTSGITTCEFLHSQGAEISAINKGDPINWYESIKNFVAKEKCFNQDSAASELAQVDLIILSPGIPREHKALSLALQQGVRVWSEIELAYHYCQCPIIAVTGTNGKTTTVTMIGEMLKNAGLKTFVGGNIGIPFCQLPLDEQHHSMVYDIAVLELSSFQLESIENFAPDVAMILNITMNHGERYQSLNDYAEAKYRIVKNMLPHQALIYPRQSRMIDKWAQTQQIILLPFNDYLLKNEFMGRFDLSSCKLKGDHNLANLYCAYKAINFLKLSESGVQKTINEFRGVHYRIEEIFELANSKWKVFNDAKSTNLEATETAIAAVSSSKDKDRNVYLIYGGQKRDPNEKYGLSKVFAQHLNKIFLIGETTEDMAHAFAQFPNVIKSYTIENALNTIKSENKAATVLFSPGFPSFDQFKNYVDRGEKFTNAVLKILQ